MIKKQYNILLTNDDGIKAEGLKALRKILACVGTIYTVAPLKESSGVSHAINPRNHIRLKKIDKWTVAVNSTPADCVKYAFFKFIKKPLHLIVSGINRGENAGSDVAYSATVAAAAEGCILGVPSIAVSITCRKPVSFYEATSYIRELCKFVLKNKLPSGTFLNVNIPGKLPYEKIKGISLASQGKKVYKDVVSERKDSKGNIYCYIDTVGIIGKKVKGNDIYALSKGYISVTPLQLNLTNYDLLKKLNKNFKNNGA